MDDFFQRRHWHHLDGGIPAKPCGIAYSEETKGFWWQRWERMTGVPVPEEVKHIKMSEWRAQPSKRRKQRLKERDGRRKQEQSTQSDQVRRSG